MTYTVTAIKGNEQIMKCGLTESQNKRFKRSYENLGYTVTYQVEKPCKPITEQTILDFYNEHISFTGEVTIENVKQFLERQ